MPTQLWGHGLLNKFMTCVLLPHVLWVGIQGQGSGTGWGKEEGLSLGRSWFFWWLVVVLLAVPHGPLVRASQIASGHSSQG